MCSHQEEIWSLTIFEKWIWTLHLILLTLYKSITHISLFPLNFTWEVISFVTAIVAKLFPWWSHHPPHPPQRAPHPPVTVMLTMVAVVGRVVVAWRLHWYCSEMIMLWTWTLDHPIPTITSQLIRLITILIHHSTHITATMALLGSTSEMMSRRWLIPIHKNSCTSQSN